MYTGEQHANIILGAALQFSIHQSFINDTSVTPVDVKATKSEFRNHVIPDQATAGQLQAAALSDRVIYQSSGTVPCCVHSVFPLTQSTKQCYEAALEVNSSATEYERTPNYLYNRHQIIFNGYRTLIRNILYFRIAHNYIPMS